MITICNRRRKNALTRAMWSELERALIELDTADDVRAIVIQGDGDDFSTGIDLKDTWEQCGSIDPFEMTFLPSLPSGTHGRPPLRSCVAIASEAD